MNELKSNNKIVRTKQSGSTSNVSTYVKGEEKNYVRRYSMTKKNVSRWIENNYDGDEYSLLYPSIGRFKVEEAASDPEKREKHLDNAYKALGGDDKKDSDQKDKSDKNDGKNKENDQKKLPAQPRPEKKEQQKQDDKTSEQLLKMLNDEENKRREELMKMRQMRRVPVKKDW